MSKYSSVHIQRRGRYSFAPGIAVVFWRDGKGHFYHPITNASLARLRRVLSAMPPRLPTIKRTGEIFYI